MALSATIYHFSIQLSDVDRGVYEALALKVARHPSESEAHLLTRVLAYCLEFAEGIGFSRGISEPDEPALSVRDLTGALKVWIDIGSPARARPPHAAQAGPLQDASNGWRRTMVSSRSGPVEIMSIGTPPSDSMRAR